MFVIYQGIDTIITSPNKCFSTTPSNSPVRSRQAGFLTNLNQF